MKKIAIALSSVLLMVGCSTTKEYEMYVDAHRARSAADVARYQALAEIAKSGDTAAKVAAVISLNMGQNGQNNGAAVAAPKSTADTILQFGSLLLPQLTQIYAINKQATTAITQSNNATTLGIAQTENTATTAVATTNAFVGIAGKIQAPAANVTTTTNNTTTTSTSTTTTAGRDMNSGASSGNSGNVAGQGISNNTATPTIVTQPAPVIVTQPAPVIVTQPAGPTGP